jgi:hypothetical protein
MSMRMRLRIEKVVSPDVLSISESWVIAACPPFDLVRQARGIAVDVSPNMRRL